MTILHHPNKKKQGWIRNIFSAAANAGVIYGLKAVVGLSLTFNPISMGAVGALAIASVATGLVVGTYDYYKKGGRFKGGQFNRRTFFKTIFTKTCFAAIGGLGAGLITDNWDAITSSSVVERAGHFFSKMSPVTDSLANQLSTLDFSKMTECIGTYTTGESRIICDNSDNELPPTAILLPEQSFERMTRIMNVVMGTDMSPPAPQMTPAPIDLSQYDVVDIRHEQYCDSLCEETKEGQEKFTMQCLNAQYSLFVQLPPSTGEILAGLSTPVEEIPSDEKPTTPEITIPAPTEYIAEKGDNPWKIVVGHYGLEGATDAEIQRAVDEILIANNMVTGTLGNNIDIGQKLILPDVSQLDLDKTQLAANWTALHEQTQSRLGRLTV